MSPEAFFIFFSLISDNDSVVFANLSYSQLFKLNWQFKRTWFQRNQITIASISALVVTFFTPLTFFYGGCSDQQLERTPQLHIHIPITIDQSRHPSVSNDKIQTKEVITKDTTASIAQELDSLSNK